MPLFNQDPQSRSLTIKVVRKALKAYRDQEKLQKKAQKSAQKKRQKGAKTTNDRTPLLTGENPIVQAAPSGSKTGIHPFVARLIQMEKELSFLNLFRRFLSNLFKGKFDSGAKELFVSAVRDLQQLYKNPDYITLFKLELGAPESHCLRSLLAGLNYSGHLGCLEKLKTAGSPDLTEQWLKVLAYEAERGHNTVLAHIESLKSVELGPETFKQVMEILVTNRHEAFVDLYKKFQERHLIDEKAVQSALILSRDATFYTTQKSLLDILSNDSRELRCCLSLWRLNTNFPEALTRRLPSPDLMPQIAIDLSVFATGIFQKAGSSGEKPSADHVLDEFFKRSDFGDILYRFFKTTGAIPGLNELLESCPELNADLSQLQSGLEALPAQDEQGLRDDGSVGPNTLKTLSPEAQAKLQFFTKISQTLRSTEVLKKSSSDQRVQILDGTHGKIFLTLCQRFKEFHLLDRQAIESAIVVSTQDQKIEHCNIIFRAIQTYSRSCFDALRKKVSENILFLIKLDPDFLGTIVPLHDLSGEDLFCLSPKQLEFLCEMAKARLKDGERIVARDLLDAFCKTPDSVKGLSTFQSLLPSQVSKDLVKEDDYKKLRSYRDRLEFRGLFDLLARVEIVEEEKGTSLGQGFVVAQKLSKEIIHFWVGCFDTFLIFKEDDRMKIELLKEVCSSYSPEIEEFNKSNRYNVRADAERSALNIAKTVLRQHVKKDLESRAESSEDSHHPVEGLDWSAGVTTGNKASLNP